jgi:hypothetical protein
MSRPSKRRAPRSPAEASRATRAVPSISAEAFPHFSTLCRAYLHEDFMQEHASVAGALDAFLRGLPAAERAAVAAEGARLVTALAELPIARLRTVLSSTFRSAWHPPTPREVIALLERMRDLA